MVFCCSRAYNAANGRTHAARGAKKELYDQDMQLIKYCYEVLYGRDKSVNFKA